ERREGVGVRLGRQRQGGGDVRQLPPRKAPCRRPAADQDRAAGGLHARGGAGARLAMRRPLSLRSRLILGVITLAAVGLLAADLATYSSLRSFLLHPTHPPLTDAHPPPPY